MVNDPISAFTAEARDYCAFVEDSPTSNSWIFTQECLTRVLRLYQAALLLPELSPESADLLEGIKHERWNTVRESIERRLSRDYYWVVFEPLEQDKPELVLGLLSDDLADIWRDLNPGITAIDSGRTTFVSNVVWNWRFSFETHWGQHAASAIYALHALCFGKFADGSRTEV